MEIRVLFFGPAKSLAAMDSLTLALPEGAVVRDLRGELCTRIPRLASALASMRLAVNQQFVVEEVVLKAGDEAAVIPPVSGG